MFAERTHCGDLSVADDGKEVVVCGWVDRRRDHGGVIFVMVRDVSGDIQVVADETHSKEAALSADKLRNEYCVYVKG
ncbi:MAG TPA: OB-fold nucleic acid binding domain-containing protein, partial [Spirochaetota bacterium]|nr:OB-fold nucleic acid binding domain-containing protein [Spirochaetota bacterium]